MKGIMLNKVSKVSFEVLHKKAAFFDVFRSELGFPRSAQRKFHGMSSKLTLRSLRNHDGNGDGNVTKQKN